MGTQSGGGTRGVVPGAYSTAAAFAGLAGLLGASEVHAGSMAVDPAVVASLASLGAETGVGDAAAGAFARCLSPASVLPLAQRITTLAIMQHGGALAAAAVQQQQQQQQQEQQQQQGGAPDAAGAASAAAVVTVSPIAAALQFGARGRDGSDSNQHVLDLSALADPAGAISALALQVAITQRVPPSSVSIHFHVVPPRSTDSLPQGGVLLGGFASCEFAYDHTTGLMTRAAGASVFPLVCVSFTTEEPASTAPWLLAHTAAGATAGGAAAAKDAEADASHDSLMSYACPIVIRGSDGNVVAGKVSLPSSHAPAVWDSCGATVCVMSV